MLKAVVEQMKLRPESRFGKLTRFVPILSHDHRHLQLARNQQRLFAEFLRQPAGSTNRTPVDCRPYPRDSTSNLIPRALSNSPSSITNGVFPDPPAERFPTLITPPCSPRARNTPRS